MIAILGFMGNGSMITKLLLLGMGALVIIGAVVAFSDINSLANENSIPGLLDFSVGIGLYVAMAAGAVIAIAAVLGLANVFPECSEE